MEMCGDNREGAAENICRSDSARGAYYRTITGREWGDRHQYDLLLDASIGTDKTAGLILQYLADRKSHHRFYSSENRRILFLDSRMLS